MTWIYLLLLGFSSADLTLPPSSDINRFRYHDITDDQNQDTVDKQRSRCREHIKRLHIYEHIRGWENGRWDTARRETESRLEYWDTLSQISEAAMLDQYGWQDERPRRRLLRNMRDLIGPERYRWGWSPALIPDLGTAPWDLPALSRTPANPSP